MAFFDISKEHVVTSKYYYENKQKRSRNHTETFESSTRFFPGFCFHNRFRALAYSEPEVDWEACQ